MNDTAPPVRRDLQQTTSWHDGHSGRAPFAVVPGGCPPQFVTLAPISPPRSPLASAPGFVVASTGGIAFATERGAAWLDADRARRIGDLVRSAARDPHATTLAVIDGHRAMVVRLHGGEAAYLVSLAEPAPAEPPTAPTPSDRALTDRQREIAEYAAVGATAGEIAATVQVSPHTVRGHLKSIYRRLGVASRVELAAALARGD